MTLSIATDCPWLLDGAPVIERAEADVDPRDLAEAFEVPWRATTYDPDDAGVLAGRIVWQLTRYQRG